MLLKLKSRSLDLSAPVVMGVLNVTPDSFSDGGRHATAPAALARAREMVEEGAGIVDVGGESTRPGAQPVEEQQELDRVLPVIEAVRAELGCVISVDTMKPGVMRAACAAGAELVNDVNALRAPAAATVSTAPGAVETVAAAGAAVCLMHMQGEPRTMQARPAYADVVREVREYLEGRVAACRAAGIAAERIALDPGIGFGKSLEHNLMLLAHLRELLATGRPVVVGVSRKSMFQALLGRDLGARLPGSLGAAAVAVWQGAAIVRAHDVAATADAVRIAHELRVRAGEQG